jgi:hypothetical protein
MAEPFAEMLEPRGERGLVGRWLSAITSFARVVGHAFDTRDRSAGSRQFRRPPRRADHTEWVWVSQETRLIR